MKMETQKREALKKAEQALVSTLKECREKIVKHIEVGEGVQVPTLVRFGVEDALETMDGIIEQLVRERDEEIDDAIEDMGR
jgi:hypothetical protein